MEKRTEMATESKGPCIMCNHGSLSYCNLHKKSVSTFDTCDKYEVHAIFAPYPSDCSQEQTALVDKVDRNQARSANHG